jgi:thiol-disulfide isomerase/thioredoxin
MIALLLSLNLVAAPSAKPAVDGGSAGHVMQTLLNQKAFEDLPAFHAKGTHVVHFWASWCEPCREELPEFLHKAQELAKQGVDFTFVSVDAPDDVEPVATPLLEKLGGFFDRAHQYVLSDEVNPDAITAKLSKGWGGEIPATFVFRDGKLAGEFRGASEDHALDGLATSPARRSSSPKKHPSR